MRLLIASIVLIVAGIAAFFMWPTIAGLLSKPSQEAACTTEAKLCPDGSYVGRTGPDCAFAQCPAATTTPPSGGGGGILPYHSGVQGTVSLGPTCPVERIPPDPRCADKPYETQVSARRAGSASTFATASSDAAGAFSMELPPGSYTLTAAGGQTLPRCTDVSITVLPDAYTSATIFCDTGIR